MIVVDSNQCDLFSGKMSGRLQSGSYALAAFREDKRNKANPGSDQSADFKFLTAS